MFIYHFNRLIRNRFLWIVFAVIVAFAFLSVDSCSFNPGKKPGVAGTLGGEVIDDARLAFAERMVGGERGTAPDTDPMLIETQAWQHLAAIQTANKLGLAATEEEVRQSIRETPVFNTQGQFDVYRFQQLVMQQLGVDVHTYQRMVSDQLSLAKLAQALSSAALISPMELDDEVAALTDSFTIQYATISNEFMHAEIELDDAALQRYFHEHVENFTLPERVAVHYASVMVTNYLPLVTVHDDDILDYYEMNSERYTRPSTNNISVTLPLEEVRDEIMAELALEEARYAASTNMAAFMESFKQCNFDNFAMRARARRMQVASTHLFDAAEYLPLIDAAAQEEFREAAFDLDPTRLDACYTVVNGDDHIYLLMGWTNSPSHTPPFAEQRDKVVPLALAQAREEAFEKLCAAKHAELLQALASSTDFTTAATALSMQTSTSLTFTAYSSGRSPFPAAQEVIPVAIRLRQGQLSEPLIGYSQARLVYVSERQEGDHLSKEIVRPQIRQTLRQRREAALITAWMRWNLERIGFDSNRTTYIVDDDASDTDYEE